MSTSASDPGAPGETRTSVTGHQLLAAFTNLGKGLMRWVQATMPTGGGMTVPRATVLTGLALKAEPTGMSELGESLGMSPRNMTVLVDGLEKEGLVSRVSHPHDRRVRLVELTEAGRRMARRELGSSQAAAAALFDEFTPEERDELLRLLRKVVDTLRARGIEMPSP